MSLLTSPHLIDLILLFTLAETGVLLAFRVMTLKSIAKMLLPGVGVMLALRAALAGTAWPWVPLCLTAALFAHLSDLFGRWRR